MTGSGPTSLNLEMADQQYLLSAALITSALLSLIQITRFKIWGTSKVFTFCNLHVNIFNLSLIYRLLSWYWFTKCCWTQFC
jgi:hypothetical protein